MPIERANSFHLMLSDDELTLLRLLAEREGLNASDYLRTLLRREAGGAAQQAMFRRAIDVARLVSGDAVADAWTGRTALPGAKAARKKPARPKKKSAG